ncbi:MAG: GNAT family N-acetyltransferase [Anaerolineae bacterium]|nr:GNAT family N-acetyltransferase [Anaerolineae bacterium]
MRPIDIRRDLPALSELIEVSFADELSRRGGDFSAELDSARRMVPLIRLLGRFSNSFQHILDGFVWEDEGRIVASVVVQKMGNDPTRWLIGTVATHPKYRRQGLARKLTMQAIEHARSCGARTCVLDVRAENAPAYNLYRGLGFTHYDSTTELKLETWPSVKPMPVEGYTLREMRLDEWRGRYDLALRATPPDVQAFMPINEAEYRVPGLMSLAMPLLVRLQRLHACRWVVERDAVFVATARLLARLTPNTTHEIDLVFDPAHRAALAEPLLTLLLSTLDGYAKQNVLAQVRTSDTDLMALLKQYGFVEIETNHRLGAKLEQNND